MISCNKSRESNLKEKPEGISGETHKQIPRGITEEVFQRILGGITERVPVETSKGIS